MNRWLKDPMWLVTAAYLVVLDRPAVSAPINHSKTSAMECSVLLGH